MGYHHHGNDDGDDYDDTTYDGDDYDYNSL